jgi:hypothetical protein
VNETLSCSFRHQLPKVREVCQATKYMMLHVRDCPGTTSTFDVCPFPWCRKTKHLLYHLVTCISPSDCAICSPQGLSQSFEALVCLNEHRWKNSTGATLTVVAKESVVPNEAITVEHSTQLRSLKASGSKSKNELFPDTFSRQCRGLESSTSVEPCAKLGSISTVDRVLQHGVAVEAHNKSRECVMLCSNDPKSEDTVFLQKSHSSEKIPPLDVSGHEGHPSSASHEIPFLRRISSSKRHLDDTLIHASLWLPDQPVEPTLAHPSSGVTYGNESILPTCTGQADRCTLNSEDDCLEMHGALRSESQGMLFSLTSSSSSHFETDASVADLSNAKAKDPEFQVVADCLGSPTDVLCCGRVEVMLHNKSPNQESLPMKESADDTILVQEVGGVIERNFVARVHCALPETVDCDLVSMSNASILHVNPTGSIRPLPSSDGIDVCSGHSDGFPVLDPDLEREKDSVDPLEVGC